MADRDLRIRMLLEAADRVTKPLKDIAGGAGRASTALKATRDRLREIERVQGDVDAFRKLKSGLATTTEAMEAARQRATQLGRDLAATEAPTRAMAREFAGAKREAEQLTRQHQAESRELTTIRSRLTEAGVSTRHLAAAEQALAADARHTNAELREQTERLEQLQSRSRRFSAAKGQFGKGQELAGSLAAGGASALAVGVGSGTVVASVAKDAMNLEDKMAGVRKVSGMSAIEIGKMAADIQQMTRTIPLTAVELAGITEDAAAAGVGHGMKDQRRQLVDFATQAAKMGTAFGMTADEAGTTMMAWREAFQAPLPKLKELGDQVNALNAKFGGKGPEIAQVIESIGSLGKVAGVSSPQVAALASRLSSLHVAPEIAATGIKNLMLQLNMGSSARKRLLMGYKAIGVDAVAIAKGMQANAGATILDVFDRVARLPKVQQTATLTNMFGRESVAPIAAMLTGLDQLKARFDLVSDASVYGGQVQREYDRRLATSSNQLKLADNRFTALKITIGTRLLPTINLAADKLGALFDRFNTFASAHPKLTQAMIVSVAVIAAMLTVLGALGIALAAIIGPFAAVSAVATFFEVGMLPIIGIAAAVVVGIGLLAAAVYLIYSNWGPIIGWFSGIWNELKHDAQGGLSGIAAMIVDFNLFGGIYRAFAMLVNWLGGSMPSKLSDVGRMLIQGLIGGIKDQLNALKATVLKAAGSTALWFRQALGIHSPSRVFHGFGGFMMEGLANGIAGGEDGPVRRIERLSRRVQGAIAAGAAVGSIAGAAHAASAPAGRAAGAPGPANHYEVHFHPSAGMDEQMLFAKFERWHADQERKKAAAGRSAYADTPDWE
ncbi:MULTISPECIES: phage tail tape measure protein [unclassified Sphingomonas]|uniref:phage tail tape measure protein n=1 Tax=unclassified Sphingomonas TaxID=196159 RepID=UPI00226AD007|nr:MULTISPECIES: phage tail tape measure protein [unclassified Sphingomonas]